MPVSPEAIQRYQQAIDTIMKKAGRMEDREVRALIKLLADVRRRTTEELSRLADRGDTSFKTYRLGALRDAIDKQAAYLNLQYLQLMDKALTTSWDAGARFQTDVLEAAKVNLSVSIEISRDALRFSQAVAGDLVANVTSGFRTEAKRVVTLGVMGERSPHDVLLDIRRLLETEPGRQDGRLGPLVYQAERIQRTEMNGAFSLANTLAQDQIAAEVPGIQKFWRAFMDRRTRPSHMAAYKRYQPGGTEGPIPEEDDFIVGGYKCRGPHDPRLPARERVMCRCRSILFSPDWVEEEK